MSISNNTEIIVAEPATAAQLNDENIVDDLIEIASSKALENRASISSIDSSISLSYDALPFTPRSSSEMHDNSTDDESKIEPAVYGDGDLVTNGLLCRKNDRNAVTYSSSGNESASAADIADKKTSQDENNDELFEPPDEEQTKRIINQVEYYFSDENIVKDAFLLKHVRRTKEGYVSLKLIASFKRIKHIARDWRMLRAALQKSTKLEVNEAGTKLRRRDPLPLYDQTTPSRTIVAVHLPPERATIENIAEMFRECGEIALIRVLRPGNPIPADVRPFYNKHPEMHASVSALVEFVRTESAHNALNREPLNEDPVRVFELNAVATKKKIPAKKAYRNDSIYDDFSSSYLSNFDAEDRYRLRTLPAYAHKTPPPMSTAIDQQQWPATTPHQPRWSRESGSDSSASSVSRSRSNSGIYFVPEQRRFSAGWDSSSCSDSYGSCRSRSNSGVSIPDIFQMRRYSLSRRESSSSSSSSYCCCGYPKCETGNRRYSIAKEDGAGGGFSSRTLSRCASNESSDYGGTCRKESIPEYYRSHRNSVMSDGGDGVERRWSLTRPCSTDGNWSRSNSCSGSSTDGRRLSDSDGQRFGGILMRQRSFNNVGVAADTVVRLPRGPDGNRGFQRELIECALPE